MNTQEQAYLLSILKVLADESRLAIIRLLNEREYNVGDLAGQLQLAEPTVSHHLSKLHGVGLLSLRMAGNQRFYVLNHKMLDKFKGMVGQIEQKASDPEPVQSDNGWIDALGWDEADQQVLRSHTDNGRLTRIPSRPKKLIPVLRWLAMLFEADRMYTEKEVNEVIKSVHTEDFVSLRRELVDFGYLRRERDGGKYWLAPEETDAPAAASPVGEQTND